MHNKNFWGACIITKYILLCFMILLTLSCQNGWESKEIAEKDQTIEKLKQRNEMVKKRLELQEKLNRELEGEIKNIRSHLAIRETIEEKGFFNEELSNDVQILPPGIYSSSEIKKDIENMEWYGLFQQGTEFTLKKTKMSIVRVRDVMRDEGDEKTGKKVTTADVQEPILFIAGLENASEGKLHTAKLEKKFLYPGEHISLKFNRYWTSISAYGTAKPTPYNGRAITAYLLEIKSTRYREQQKQIFAGAKQLYGGGYRFIWAGDLDRDGLPDLIMDLSNNEKGSSTTALFLSSYAEEGQLIKKVAELTTLGC